jgi:hypothetical protein
VLAADFYPPPADLADTACSEAPEIHREPHAGCTPPSRPPAHLGSIHQQQRPLAGRQRPANLVAEVHVARGVHQVEQVVGALVAAHQGHRLGLDGDASLALHLRRGAGAGCHMGWGGVG